MNKNEIMEKFEKMIMRSWTYQRLTKTEKQRWDETIEHPTIKNIVKGTEKQRWDILNGLYFTFLNGCGYSGGNWRE